jgi:hypothetical protein
MLDSDASLRHPAAAYIIAATAQKIASYWDGVSVREDDRALIEAHMRPKIEAVLDAAEGDAAQLIDAIDALARGYADVLPTLKAAGP